MKIYSPSGQLIIDEVGDKSYRYRTLMGQHNLTVYVSYTDALEIVPGCYLDYQGIRYTVRRKPSVKKNGNRNLEYTVIFESPQVIAEKRTIRLPADSRLKFPYTAIPKEHIKLITDNLNSIDSGWTVGECIEGVHTLISYNHTKSLDALKTIADTFKTEFEIDSANKVIHLRKTEYNKDNPIPLAYGLGGGFKVGLFRDNVDSSVPVEILAVQGGSRNIDYSKYGNSELLLPKNQTLGFDGVKFEDEDGFDGSQARYYKVDAEGLTIRRADKELVSYEDGSTDLSSIYPMRVGTVTGVEVTEAGNYNIIDATIPDNLDYSQYRIDGEEMTIVFQSGMLSGKEFNLVQTDNKVTGYDHQKRRFMLVSQEYSGQTMPNDTFAPQPKSEDYEGDKYAVFGMMMPDEYIRDDDSRSGASWELFRQGIRVIYEEEQDKFSFTGILDGIWSKRFWHVIGGKIVIGGYARFTDYQMLDLDDEGESVLIRITGIKDYVYDSYKPEITLANVTAATYASDFRKIPENEVKAEAENNNTVNYVKRGFRGARETLKMLQESLLNFTEGISPITVQTMALLVGDESLQFRFVTSKTDPQPDTGFSISFNPDDKILTATGSILQHMTLGIDSISPVHAVSDYKFWKMFEYNSPPLVETSKAYWLYARCKTDMSDSEFYLSESAIPMGEASDEFYYFLVGILNTEVEGNRSFAPLYGFTEVLPGRITTDRIVSSDGNNFIDLLNNAMRIGNSNRYLAWNVVAGLLEIMNATLEIKNSDGDIVANIKGDNGNAMFGKGAVEIDASGKVMVTPKDMTSRFQFGNISDISSLSQAIMNWNGIKINAGNLSGNATAENEISARRIYMRSLDRQPQLAFDLQIPENGSNIIWSVDGLPEESQGLSSKRLYYYFPDDGSDGYLRVKK